MDLVNLILLALGLAGAVTGWIKGFIGQAGALAGFVLGILACRLHGDEFTAWLSPTVAPDGGNEFLITAGCNIVLFIIVYIVVLIASHVLRSLVKVVCLGLIDRVAGVIFGIVKWWLLAGVVLTLWAVLNPDSPVATAQHCPVAYARDGALWLLGVGVEAFT